MKEILIQANDENQCSCTFGKDQEITWPEALLMLWSTIEYLAEYTVKIITEGILKDNPDAKYEDIEAAVKMDMADQVNFCASNVLNTLCPKDPDMELSEVAIATCENIIIHHAKEHNMDIKDALNEAEEILSQYIYAAKPIGENGENMACGKKKKGGKGK